MADVGVNFGGGDAGVAEEFLDEADVDAVFEKVGGERMAEGMDAGGFFDSGFGKRDFKDFFSGAYGNMRTGVLAGKQPRVGLDYIDVNFERFREGFRQ